MDQWEPLLVPQQLGPPKICFICSSLEKFKNLESKVENEKFDLKAPGAMIPLSIQEKN